MIYIDTNILIRLMTDDVPALREQAEDILSRFGAGDLFVPDIVFTELFFVLEHNKDYMLKREQVCELLALVLQAPQFATTASVLPAIKIARQNPKLDFTDCMLAVYADRTENLITFDKRLLKQL